MQGSCSEVVGLRDLQDKGAMPKQKDCWDGESLYMWWDCILMWLCWGCAGDYWGRGAAVRGLGALESEEKSKTRQDGGWM